MLSREENWLNIWAIKNLSQTRVIPVQIDTRTGRIRVVKDMKAQLAWLGYLAAVQLHSFFAFFCFTKLLGQGLKRTKWELPFPYYKIFVPQLATLVAVVPFSKPKWRHLQARYNKINLFFHTVACAVWDWSLPLSLTRIWWHGIQVSICGVIILACH